MSGLFRPGGPRVDGDDPEALKMPFGKHIGRTLGWIVEHDLLYLDWLVDQEIRSPQLRAAVRALCDTYAAEISRGVDAQG
jgi:hypothetical protein